MPDFIFRANIAHYRDLLEHETDPQKIMTLRSLLCEEQAKLEDWEASQQQSTAAKRGTGGKIASA